MRSIIFAKRNIKEIIRDPISYIFLFAFPIVMLFIMSAINAGIPESARVDTFKIENLSVGICVFSFSFDMLFAALQISSDRGTAFLSRLYSSPMTTASFIIGYLLPLLITAIAQCVVVFILSALPLLANGYYFSLLRTMRSVLLLLPSALLFIGIGILFGSLFNNKAAPPLSSVIITVSGMLGGIWMDPELLGSPLFDICKALPFYHCVQSGRIALNGNIDEALPSFIIIIAYTVIIFTACVLIFHKQSKS